MIETKNSLKAININKQPKTMTIQVGPTTIVTRKVEASLILSVNLFSQEISRDHKKLTQRNSSLHHQTNEETLELANQT